MGEDADAPWEGDGELCRNSLRVCSERDVMMVPPEVCGIYYSAGLRKCESYICWT